MAIRLGIIGTGMIAGMHIKGIAEKDDYEFVAGCDIKPGRAKKFCEKWGAPEYYEDQDSFFKKAKVDAVLVCTPNAAHKAATVRALENDIHVYCEKPMATSVAECEEMIAARDASKAHLTIGHHQRFIPEFSYINKVSSGGDLGEVYFARTVFHRRGGVPWWGEFHIMEKSGGGSLIDIGVHMIDMALWQMGNPTPIQVVGQTYMKLAKATDGSRPNQNKKKAAEFDVDDFASAYVKMSNGATLAIECSWAANRKPKMEQILELYGDKGGASFKPVVITTQAHGEFVDIEPMIPKGGEPHAAATAHFAKVIRGEAGNIIKPEQTLNVQKILDGIYHASSTGEVVNY